MKDIWKPNKLKIKPVKTISLFDNSMSYGMGKRAHTLPDSGNQREPTPQDIARYKKEGDKWVNDICMKSLRTHRNDVLHGGKSLNILLPSKRKSKDFDIYSPMEKSRARELEAKLDKRAKANLFETRFIPIPKSPFTIVDKSSAKELYRIMTRNVHGDSDVDLMHRQPGLDVVRKGGILHESLPSQYQRTLQSIMHPLRMWKGLQDKKRIEQFYKDKGQELPRQEYNSRGIPLLIDTDRDFYMDSVDCDPNDPTKGGLLGGLIRRRKARKEIETVEGYGMEPSEEQIENLMTAEGEVEEGKEKLEQTGGNIEMSMEKHLAGIEEYIQQVPEEFRGNIRKAVQNVKKGLSRFATNYTKRAESRQSDPYQHRNVFQNINKSPLLINDESRIHRGYQRGVTFSVPGFRGKAFGDSSVPDISYQEKMMPYVPFKPHTTGVIYHPHRCPSPQWLIEKQQKRELARQYLRQVAVKEAQEGEL